MSQVPIDPTQPREPVVVPYRRPAPVTIAALLMLLGAVLGAVSAIMLFVAAGTVVSQFEDNARDIEVSSQTIDDAAALIRSVFIGVGVIGLLLAVAMAALAFGVLAGRNWARIVTWVVIVGALCTGLASAAYTSVGRNADWTVNVDNADERLAAEVGQAYSDAVPAWLVGTTGGLTDLQALSYIAVAVLLLVPASNVYFRRRSAPTWQPPTTSPSTTSSPTAPPNAPPSTSAPTAPGTPPSATPYPPPPPPPTYPPPPMGPPGPPGPPGPSGPTGGSSGSTDWGPNER